MNVWRVSFCYCKRYYLTHPWMVFPALWRGMKWTYQRATKGYCGVDAWDLDHYLLGLLPPMLAQIRDNGCAYPGDSTPEQWHELLTTIIDKLAIAADDDEITMEQYERQAKAAKEAFELIGEHFFKFWD